MSHPSPAVNVLLGRERRWRRLAVLAASMGSVAVVPTAAQAAGCPRATATTRDLLVTQGVDDGRTQLVRRGRPESDSPVDFRQKTEAFGFDDGHLYRDGAIKQPFVRDTRNARGRGTLTLCTQNGRVAILPSLERGRRLAGVSVNGRYVAWRSVRGGRGTLAVGRVVGGRARAVRQIATVSTRPRDAVDGRIQVSARGDVVWALAPAAGATARRSLWVWPRGRSVKAIRRPAGVADPHVVRLLDDQHVVLDDAATTLRFARATPGRCPRLDVGKWRSLGALRAADAGGATDAASDERVTTAWVRTLVCDPASGRYRRVLVTRGDGVPGHSTTVFRLVTTGPWLLVERVLASQVFRNVFYTWTTEVQHLDDRSTTTVPGGIAGPGVAAPPSFSEMPDSSDSRRIVPPVGAHVRSGVVAWRTPVAPEPRATVTVADADGQRDVGTATSELTLTDTTLTWTDSTISRQVPVRPSPEAQLAVAQFAKSPY